MFYRQKYEEQTRQASHKKRCSSAEVKCVLHSAEGFKEPKRLKTKTLEKVYLNDRFKDYFSPFQMAKLPPNTSWGMGPNIFSGGYTPTTLAPENMQTPKIECSSERHFSGANRYTPETYSSDLPFQPSIFRCELLVSGRVVIRIPNNLFQIFQHLFHCIKRLRIISW